MLKVKNLFKAFGENHVLSGISFNLETNKIYCLVGPNGSGKTTLFNILSGFLKPDSGQIILHENSLIGKSPVTINKAGISRTFQDLRLITELTVKENVLLSFKDNPGEKFWTALLPSRLYAQTQASFEQRAQEIIQACFLELVANNKAGEISYGQQKLLTLACCMANDPQVLLLDEPVAGINPEYRKKMVLLLQQLKADGKTILVIEHNTDFIEAVCDALFFINDGTLVAYNTYNELKNNALVMEAYLS